uniref:peptidylprolyl isomerase n=1 Tax=Rhodosorus marinus TaxID=101924 RepID=A0A7S2ZSE8_9RHOD|mmetsp:Transcript_28991/g.112753  ORF Transcript_28991/g.112753 Transcript_28991/m.112753 type:complete len:212 (+) Transcript_28991:243-878(+)|eukprot:CAMPEP_0113960334 /NCGR_PEP_ID=MMETSP0011_2-20120614/4651_1 /TAXON_ID=101924 /ORGANISM="Rhodosorus marinus" /LENGTH=211 /DNA_ID=CAMNT_0000971763 /DNA_START=271 /DNA_END=906 /DNA_ORIENTATION=- /assembly_acc=CAM_ASM_000156
MAEIRDASEVRKALKEADDDEYVDASGDGGVKIRRLRAPREDQAAFGNVETPYVEVHYEGFLEENGDLFDSSRASGYPFVVLLGKGKVIAGWEVALQVLRLSEMAEVLIRSDYGYGEEENDDIPAGSTLKFIIEVLDVRSTPKPVSVAPMTTDADAKRLDEIRKQREEAARQREEDRKAAEEAKKKAAEAAAARLANKGQKGGKGKNKKKK